MNRDYIFNDNLKTLEQVIEVYSNSVSDKLKAVLRVEVYQKMIQNLEEKKAEADSDKSDE